MPLVCSLSFWVGLLFTFRLEITLSATIVAIASIPSVPAFGFGFIALFHIVPAGGTSLLLCFPQSIVSAQNFYRVLLYLPTCFSCNSSARAFTLAAFCSTVFGLSTFIFFAGAPSPSRQRTGGSSLPSHHNCLPLSRNLLFCHHFLKTYLT